MIKIETPPKPYSLYSVHAVSGAVYGGAPPVSRRVPQTLLWVVAILFLTGCASTTLYENGQKVLTTQADATNVTFKTGNGTYFHADVLIHSTPTLAGGQATSQVVTSVGAVAVPLVLAAGTGGASTGVQAAAVAASTVPAVLSQAQGVVRPTNLYIQNQWVSAKAPAHTASSMVSVRGGAKHRHHHHRHVANASPPKD